MGTPPVIVAHNRYRQPGGEERCVELQLEALRSRSIPVEVVERSSLALTRISAARCLLDGGERGWRTALEAVLTRMPGVEAIGNERFVLHAHNLWPSLGPRLLEAARALGGRTVLQLHNLRLSCAIGIAWRDGQLCDSCRGRFTVPGLVHRCRGSTVEAIVYATALARHYRRLIAATDRFIVPSRWAGERAVTIGVPRERIAVVPHYVPSEALVARSHADRGRYALVAARLVPEKGVERALRACARAGVPLVVAGTGPERPRLEALARALDADCEFVGWVAGGDLARLRRNAAFALVPSLVPEFAPYAALEAMAGGLPVVCGRAGALPEIVGAAACVDADAADGGTPAASDATERFATRVAELWNDPARRREEGERNLEQVRSDFSRDRYLDRLLGLYGELSA